MPTARKTPARKPAKRKVPPKGEAKAAAKAAAKPSASPAVQKAKAQVAQVVAKKAATTLGVKASDLGGRPLRPIEVEMARRAHIDDLYHRLVKPAPRGKR